METKVTDTIGSLFEKTSDYLETRINLYKLKAVDKTSDVLSTIISRLIIVLVFIMFIFVLNIGIALLLGEWLGKSYYGFFVLAGFYLIAGTVIMLMRKKWIKAPMMDKIIQKFLN